MFIGLTFAPHSARLTALYLLMTIDGFLTLLALVVAVVAVIPSAMRRALGLKFGACEWLVLTISFFAVLFLEYYNAAKVIFHIPPFGVATAYHLTPQY